MRAVGLYIYTAEEVTVRCQAGVYKVKPRGLRASNGHDALKAGVLFSLRPRLGQRRYGRQQLRSSLLV